MTDISTSIPPWSDESRPRTDITGRAEFARVVADRIDHCVDGQGSTVFGVLGPWGSGKTTLLREITGQLCEWKCVWFSPWSVADVGSITAEFISALSEAFPQSKTLKEKLAFYSRFGTPALKVIPVVGDAVATVAEQAIASLTERPAWHTEFGKLSAEIAAQHERVLVIVDDVDRLDADELRSLLRVVRLLGRFTNVHYLIAYDQTTIDEILDSTAMNGGSSEFMEKIVQYPFEVPPTPMVVRRRWSRAILDTLGAQPENSGGLFAEDHEQLVGILASGLETPRAAERLREQMLSLATLVVGAEVDFLDFTALTWLRIAHHSIWDNIRLNPDEYLSWRENDSDEMKAERMLRIGKLVQRGHRKPAEDAVRFLFDPQGLTAAFSGRRWRMQMARCFDRYFQVGLADDDVSERRTNAALLALVNGHADGDEGAELRAIILGDDQERSALALEIAGKLRGGSSITSLAILDFVESIHTSLQSVSNAHLFQRSGSDRWLAREIFLALETRLVSEGALVARFGYQILAASAYAANRSREHEGVVVKGLYSAVARRWINEVRTEALGASLAREELLPMTSFCLWLQSVEDHRGFLSERIGGVESLIDVATSYVYYNEWVGVGIDYDVVFRSEEFRFAVEGVMTAPMLAELPTASISPDYDVSDRTSPDLTEAQRRDFAVRSLHENLA